MSRYPRILLYVCMILLCATAANAARAKMPPGSFITKPVQGVEGLCSNIEGDPMVASRFSSHYKMSAASLTRYLRENTRVSTLEKSGTYLVYYIDTAGQISRHYKRLKAGTPVLVGPYGRPLIELECGNPMGKTLPKPIEPGEPVVPRALEQPRPIAATAPTAEVPESPPVQAPPELEPVVEVLPTAPLELVQKIIPGILALGAVGALSGSSSSVVPEPAGLITLGMGGFGFGLLLFRYRKNTRGK